MSKENVEFVRSIYEHGLLDSADGYRALAEAQVEYVNPPDAVEPGVRRGTSEVYAALSSLADAFDRSENRLKRIYDGGDAVVAEVVFHGRGAASGAEVMQEEAHTWTFRDGRLVRFEWGRDLAAALQAVGLAD